MRDFGPLFIFLISSVLLQGTVALAQARDYHEQINSMLEKLLPVEVAKGQNILVQGPSSETQQRVRNRLLQIADESSESKTQVVEALIRVLEQPPSTEQSIIAHRWTTAVDLLGDLGAIEAVDILVKNLDQTGQNGILISLHYRPVAKAIAKIGEPAVPRLIVALSDENPDIQDEAAATLASIGQPGFAKLEEALHTGSAETKSRAALTLTWIGGREARAIIERAIEAERDQDTLTKLKDALKEMRSRWGNEN